ncbi:ABC transporter ATP-binding protein [Paenibacillus sp. CMAA1739]|uniref:ABC transporter ATP-binding protein n=1 Tax=Paenibacillus ottowii TaxID=2315729 RepID=UPI00272F3E18|nr:MULTISPECIES: ABC transporter ATP-binding protein [Paenibacillus]MDP1512273.1 ABC transporter ATP-binding protein [Paenibacillus ottowii]MEC4567622.1 ABC transporter ATP-binding protein [Paenibacillus sp. CMAA1739]
MEREADHLNIRAIFHSFQYWPKLTKLLWNTKPIYFIIIIIGYLLKGILPIANLLSIQYLVSGIETRPLSHMLQISIVYPLVLVMFSGLLISSLIEYSDKLFQITLINQLQTLIVQQTSTFNLSDFENPQIHNQLKRVQNDSIDRPIQIYKELINLLSSMVTLCSSIAILLAFRWWILLILILSPLASFYSLLRFTQIQYIAQKKRAPLQRKSRYINYLLTNDKSFKEILLYQLSDYLTAKYKSIFDIFYKEDKYLAKKRITLYLSFQVISTLVIAITLIMIIQITWKDKLLVGSVYALVQAVLLTNQNINTVSQGLISLCDHNLYLDELFAFFNIKHKQENSSMLLRESDICADSTIECIEFKNVSFAYPDQKELALKDISFKMKRGEPLALVGRNGSGKTTVIKLLTGLYEDFEGDILINSISIRNYNKEMLYKKVGVIFQDFVQFDFSVRENIGFGSIGDLELDTRIWESAQQTGVDSVIRNLPNQLEHQLGRNFEGGVQLSGGQWQKMAISRALFKEADVYVLDEPSSFLDPESEKQVFRQFQNYVMDRLCLYISHRYTSVLYADKILVMEKGQIVEEGTHQELIKSRGFYYNLFSDEIHTFQKALVTNDTR